MQGVAGNIDFGKKTGIFLHRCKQKIVVNANGINVKFLRHHMHVFYRNVRVIDNLFSLCYMRFFALKFI